MQISNFDNIRVGSCFPQCIDCFAMKPHEENGVFAVAHTFSGKYERKIQLRKSKDGYGVALFNFEYSDDFQIPDEWKDSELIWEQIIPASKK